MCSRRACAAASRGAWWFAVVAGCAFSGFVHADEPRILYAEPVLLTSDRTTALRKTSSDRLSTLQFAAYGRRFELALDANRTLLDGALTKSSASTLQLYRGRLEGVSDSWVRLAVKNGVLQGMVWDGADLYAIEPLEHVRDALAPQLSTQGAQHLIFRLADVRLDADETSCATGDANAQRTGAQAYLALVSELKEAPLSMQATTTQSGEPALGLQISAIGDMAFLAHYTDAQHARDAMLVRLNNVDGIFSSQLGVQIRAPSVLVDEAISNAFSGATRPGDLLEELGRLRERTPQLYSSGLTHLFTGRDMEGSTVGVAYLDRLCDRRYGAGLSEARASGAWRDSLVAAHELGHNFGAGHDGDPGGSCASSPADAYLMAASVSGNDQFSQCSLESMRRRLQSASCITALAQADVAVPTDLGVSRHSASRPFEWTLEATNIGGLTAQRVRAEIFMPAAMIIEDANVIGGSCTSGAGAVFCELGDIPGATRRVVSLTLRAEAPGSNSISARIRADNDASLANDSGEGLLLIGYEADVATTLSGPHSALTANTFELNFQLSNAGKGAADAVTLSIDAPTGVSILAAGMDNGECRLTQTRVRCTVQSLAADASVNGSLTLSSSSSGAHTFIAHVEGDYVDPSPANDTARHTVQISPVPATSQQAGGRSAQSGGGGAMSWPLLMFLLGSLRLRKIR